MPAMEEPRSMISRRLFLGAAVPSAAATALPRTAFLDDLEIEVDRTGELRGEDLLVVRIPDRMCDAD